MGSMELNVVALPTHLTLTLRMRSFRCVHNTVKLKTDLIPNQRIPPTQLYVYCLLVKTKWIPSLYDLSVAMVRNVATSRALVEQSALLPNSI